MGLIFNGNFCTREESRNKLILSTKDLFLEWKWIIILSLLLVSTKNIIYTSHWVNFGTKCQWLYVFYQESFNLAKITLALILVRKLIKLKCFQGFQDTFKCFFNNFTGFHLVLVTIKVFADTGFKTVYKFWPSLLPISQTQDMLCHIPFMNIDNAPFFCAAAYQHFRIPSAMSNM